MIISFYSKDINTFNELKILLLKDRTIFVFTEGFHMPHRQSSLIEDRIFHYKIPFSLNFTSLKKILQWVKSRTRMFNAFYVQQLALNKLILHFLEKIKKKNQVAQKGSVKKLFFEILQNSQENTCVRVSFSVKLQDSGLY